LNDDFRKMNSNFNSNTPAAFKAVAADVQLEFCLATTDINGNASAGVTRTSIASNFNVENNYFNAGSGGVPAWDRNKYLNIWVGAIGGGTLGFAYLPGTANANEDGVVIDYRAFGTTGTAGSGGFDEFGLGRTTTHEVGHFLNLEHIWGYNNGGCGEDDYVSDTPSQNQPSGGCPSGVQTDNCTGAPNGIMYQNYMDYSDDACMSLFTNGQKTRMLAALNASRPGLLSSNACSGTNQNCPESLVVSSITESEYKSVQNIESNATISNGQNVTFSASTSILLQPNFTVNAGGIFAAMIEECPE
jgi:hypothetical protein